MRERPDDEQRLSRGRPMPVPQG
uniref:Uncharacterized protein n=1 Tax=Arundo donax TaxID=35708 RepID=A0A0A9G5A0_ARUDO